MKILSWNINGIRSAKDCFKDLLTSISADIVCLQETKITRDQLDEDTAIIEGYNSYFSFSKKRSGYSGVATICKNSVVPIGAEEGLSDVKKSNQEKIPENLGDDSDFTVADLQALDAEGRSLITKHKIRFKDGSEGFLSVINVYCPRADMDNLERLSFKIQFCKLLQMKAEALLKSGSHVIIIGDINIAHKPTDTCKEIDLESFNKNEGRKWLNSFIVDCEDRIELEKLPGENFIDTFRYHHPNRKDAYTCWCTVTGSRQTNYGTRIDYIFANASLVLKCFKSSEILPHIEGSDHCPIIAELDCECLSAKTHPLICTKFWPEFSGKQQKLLGFFKNSQQSDEETISSFSKNQKNSERTLTKISNKSINIKKTRTKTLSSQNLIEKFFMKTEKQNVSEANSNEVQNKPSLDQFHSVSSNNETCKPQKEKGTVVTWKNLLKGPEPPPLCKGHKEPCVLRQVKKPGTNFGRYFYVCVHPEGPPTNPNSRCDFFQWKNKNVKNQTSKLK